MEHDKPTDSKLEQYIPQMIETLKGLQSSTAWIKNQDKPCQTFYKEEEDRIVVKGVKTMPFTIQQITKFMGNDQNFMKINQMCIQHKVLHKKQGKFRIIYTQIKLPWPMDNRQTVMLFAKHKENSNKVYLLNKSIDYPYPYTKGVVRAENRIGGFILQKLDQNQTKMTTFADFDPKGSIPNIIKKQVAKKRAQAPARIEQRLRQQPVSKSQTVNPQISKMLTALKHLQTQTNWHKDQQKPCQTFFKQQGQNIIVKGTKILPFSIDQIIQFMSNDENFMKINQQCAEYKVLKKGQDNYKIIYAQMKLPWPMDNRQTILMFSKQIQSPNKAYLFNKSVDYPYPETKGVIRAQSIIGGFILQKIGTQQTKMTTYGNFDPKGSIPNIIKKQVAKKRAQAPAKIEQKMKQHYGK